MAPDQHGRFSVRNAYSWALRMKLSNESSRSSGMNPRNAWNIIWKCNIPQKVNIFGWKTVSNGPATLETRLSGPWKEKPHARLAGQKRKTLCMLSSGVLKRNFYGQQYIVLGTFLLL